MTHIERVCSNTCSQEDTGQEKTLVNLFPVERAPPTAEDHQLGIGPHPQDVPCPYNVRVFQRGAFLVAVRVGGEHQDTLF